MAERASTKKPWMRAAIREILAVLGIPGVFLMAPLIQACLTIIGGGTGFLAWYILHELMNLAFMPVVLRELVNFTYMPVIAVLIGLAWAYLYGTFLYLNLAGEAWYWFYTHEELERGISWYWRYK